MVIRYEDLREAPADLHKPSKKRKQLAYDTHELVQKPHKKKVVQHKKIEKGVEKVIALTVLMPTKTRSGRTHHKVSSSSASSNTPVRKKKVRKMFVLIKLKWNGKKMKLGYPWSEGNRLQMLKPRRLWKELFSGKIKC